MYFIIPDFSLSFKVNLFYIYIYLNWSDNSASRNSNMKVIMWKSDPKIKHTFVANNLKNIGRTEIMSKASSVKKKRKDREAKSQDRNWHKINANALLRDIKPCISLVFSCLFFLGFRLYMYSWRIWAIRNKPLFQQASIFNHIERRRHKKIML